MASLRALVDGLLPPSDHDHRRLSGDGAFLRGIDHTSFLWVLQWLTTSVGTSWIFQRPTQYAFAEWPVFQQSQLLQRLQQKRPALFWDLQRAICGHAYRYRSIVDQRNPFWYDLHYSEEEEDVYVTKIDDDHDEPWDVIIVGTTAEAYLAALAMHTIGLRVIVLEETPRSNMVTLETDVVVSNHTVFHHLEEDPWGGDTSESIPRMIEEAQQQMISFRRYLRLIAAKHNVTLVSEVTVHHVTRNEKGATGVECTAAHGYGRRLLRAKHCVIAAAGALETPLLLRRSGLRNPNIGRGLRVYPSLPVTFVCDRSILVAATSKDGLATARMDSAQMALQIPWTCPSEYKDWMRKYRFAFSAVATVPSPVPGWINRQGRVALRYPDGVSEMLTKGSERLVKVVTSDLHGIITDIVSFRCRATTAANGTLLQSTVESPMELPFTTQAIGGCCLAVDPFGETWECDNLFVLDGSIYAGKPSSHSVFTESLACSVLALQYLRARLLKTTGRTMDERSTALATKALEYRHVRRATNRSQPRRIELSIRLVVIAVVVIHLLISLFLGDLWWLS